ncbi:MAG: hypothetical protein ACR2OO_09180 [Thermomicrobiales bacterium]
MTTVVIEPDDRLLRRIFWGNFDEKKKTVNSSAFRREPELSVYLERLQSADEALAVGRPGQGVAMFLARVALDLGLTVVHDPVLPNEYGHCLINGIAGKAMARALAVACTVIVEPQPAPPNQVLDD